MSFSLSFVGALSGFLVYYDSRPDIDSVFIKATGGTLFLDHIESCGPRLQEKLLQALETGAIYNEAYTEPAEFDVRLLQPRRPRRISRRAL